MWMTWTTSLNYGNNAKHAHHRFDRWGIDGHHQERRTATSNRGATVKGL